LIIVQPVTLLRRWRETEALLTALTRFTSATTTATALLVLNGAGWVEREVIYPVRDAVLVIV
jgi:hypothetical protein